MLAECEQDSSSKPCSLHTDTKHKDAMKCYNGVSTRCYPTLVRKRCKLTSGRTGIGQGKAEDGGAGREYFLRWREGFNVSKNSANEGNCERTESLKGEHRREA